MTRKISKHGFRGLASRCAHSSIKILWVKVTVLGSEIGTRVAADYSLSRLSDFFHFFFFFLLETLLLFLRFIIFISSVLVRVQIC